MWRQLVGVEQWVSVRNVDRTGVFLFYLIEVQTDSGLFLRSDSSTIGQSVWLRWVEFV